MNSSDTTIQHGKSGRKTMPAIVTVLVCLALIAVLIPQCSRGKREKAAVVSARNLQQWGIGLNLYLIDNENLMPEAGAPRVDADLNKAWYNALPVYLARKPLAEIPPEQRPEPGQDSIWMDPAARGAPDATGFYFSYAMNRHLNPDPQFPTFKIYEIRDPARTIFLVDVSQSNPGALPGDVEFRHGDKSDPMAHVLFCDGHVQLVKKDNFDPPADDNSQSSKEMRASWQPRSDSPTPVEF